MAKLVRTFGFGDIESGPLRRISFIACGRLGPYGPSVCISILDRQDSDVVVWSKTFRMW